ncbi:M48 family metallopeptidase [Caminibacter mediatlanticus]|uniref:YgjP-like metallopeptidase domain-containing protein n=1 Tax=Caminibacter mediatlanticus TB-2 TaxID=391592 RepID=A0AAI9F2Z2_9BACT|nr:M48 family metallopeptidase [Caminibacter mediatlanticus]EDM24096.1 hypothetical protein CMTB2_07571 [Caminibacter mediatlanticus TB-2]
MKVKIIRKNIKHMYIENKGDYIEVRCNKYLSDEEIYKFLDKIKDKFQKIKKKELVFGKEGKITQKDYEKLKEIINFLINKYSKKMNLYPSKISFREKNTSWGSCTYKNHITFNLKLVSLPVELIEYVVVHELAHIKEKNHSKKFWKIVEKYLPDYKDKIKKIRKIEKVIR